MLQWLSQVGFTEVMFAFASLSLLFGFRLQADGFKRSYAFAVCTLFIVLSLISLVQTKNPAATIRFYAVALLAMMPAALVGQRALYLGEVNPPFRPKGRPIKALDTFFLPHFAENGLEQARRSSERDFGWDTLSLRSASRPSRSPLSSAAVSDPCISRQTAGSCPTNRNLRLGGSKCPWGSLVVRVYG